MSIRERARATSSGVRVAVTASIGVVAGVIASLFTSWQAAILWGWDGGVGCLLLWVWLAVWKLSATETKSLAARQDPSIRLSELIVLSAGVALLAAVGLVLVRAGHATGGTKAYLITLGVLSVALSWAMVHTVFTLRYARTYYSTTQGGIDFSESDPPTYLYFAWDDVSGVRYKPDFQTNTTDCPSARAVLILVWCGHRCPCHQRGGQPSSLIRDGGQRLYR